MFRRSGGARPGRARRRRARSRRGGAAARARPGRRSRARRSTASSAGSNGNRARTTSIAWKTPPLTVPLGTSERKAIGSETMNASSELARTSRAAPPIAPPNAAKPAPPAITAARISGARPHSIETSGVSAASSRSVTASDARIPSTIFSTSSPVVPTRPRVIRENAFSSRSSASEPATSRTVTNISVTVAATAIANESSSDVDPETTTLSTLIGSATAPSSGSAKSRLSRARPANWITSSSAGAGRAPLRQLARRPGRGSRRPSRARARRGRRSAAR